MSITVIQLLKTTILKHEIASEFLQEILVMVDNTCRDTWVDIGVVTTGIDSTCIEKTLVIIISSCT